ncbi:protein tyrosine phosphatase domain-containing protein 1 isoform X29 [Macaca fascicularis]|uniref:protein tyrosine phosphatase domain-containing protein 1 isoform X29 n=1 Tax=Macaca fascicularis TaxID=9541 RepID=UPI003D1552CD
MAAGVLPQNEQPYSTFMNNSKCVANMKGNLERPTPKYTKVGERLRHVIPGHMACSMACGGRACKYENPARWSEQEQAIKGVYSSWVTDNILAMARPSSELLEKYHIIDQFLSHGIKTIINLQRPGEHASCGNPLEQESGFTYLPEAFMEAGIYFYNFGWKDYGVASLTTILDMVKVMTFALQEGKVAIHCHAGLGRTVATTALSVCSSRHSSSTGFRRYWHLLPLRRPSFLCTAPSSSSVPEQMCLSDEEPMCRIFKLFGDHSSRQVAKIADAYTERKALLRTFSRCCRDLRAQPRKLRTHRGSSDLPTSATSRRTMIETIGNCLISGIHSCSCMVTLKQELELEHGSELERMQWVARDLTAPHQLCHQMLRLLQQHPNAVQFLQASTKSSG